jgi:hypothetical protein
MTSNGSQPRVETSTLIGDLVDARPETLEVLEEFGIRLDPWTMIALKCTVQELAEYSAIRHAEELRDALRARLRSAGARS